MRCAAILCPGPSLRTGLRYPYFLPWIQQEGAAVLCVNRARHQIDAHDWWVSGDAGRNADPESVADARTRTGVFSNRLVPGAPTTLWSAHGVPATQYSSIAALYLAAALGCTHILVEGADMFGMTYCDGTHGDTLHAARWQHERALWSQAIDELKRRHIEVLQLTSVDEHTHRLVN